MFLSEFVRYFERNSFQISIDCARQILTLHQIHAPFLENYLFVINLFSDELTLVKETTLMPIRFVKPSQKLVASFVCAYLNLDS